jgi:CBS domain-containing protein
MLMLVRQILGTKGGTDVVTIGSGATVTEAAKLLSEKRIGAVIVTDTSGAAVGIMSERDIVRELGRRGPACMDDTVDVLMTKEMISTRPDETTDQVLKKMTEGRFRHMPVMEDGAMAGLISIGDVVKARLSELAMEKDALEGMIKGF